MVDLAKFKPASQGIQILPTYAEKVKVPATLLYGMPARMHDVALEEFGATATGGLMQEIQRRQENLRFVLKQVKTEFLKLTTPDTVLNRRLAKEKYTSIMNIEILNPMGLRAPLLEYSKVILEGTQISREIIAKLIPAAKVYLAGLVASTELKDAKPSDSYHTLFVYNDPVKAIKAEIAKMLDSKYENPTVTFGTHFKRIKDWEDCSTVNFEISKSLQDIAKHDFASDIRLLTAMIDKLSVTIKRGGDDSVSAPNIKRIKLAVYEIAEAVSFVGAIMHLADTLVNVMEDNKEFLRDYLSK